MFRLHGFGGVLALVATACQCSPTTTSDPPAWLDTLQVVEPRVPLRGWSLERSDGARFSEHQFLGRTSVVFVGYTRCPDVCPQTLALLASWPASSDLQVVFLSVDPDHDREGLAEYTQFFDDAMIGVTGNRAAIDHAVGQLGAAYTFEEGLVEHSTSLFVVDENANLSGLVLRPSTTDAVRKDVERLLQHHPPRVRASLAVPPGPPGAPGVAFGRLEATEAVTLVGLTSPEVERIELHRTVRTPTSARMEPVPALALEPHQPVVLAPGDLHLMLIGERATAPVVELHFETGASALVATHPASR